VKRDVVGNEALGDKVGSPTGKRIHRGEQLATQLLVSGDRGLSVRDGVAPGRAQVAVVAGSNRSYSFLTTA
jgi:hypothetical protein